MFLTLTGLFILSLNPKYFLCIFNLNAIFIITLSLLSKMSLCCNELMHVFFIHPFQLQDIFQRVASKLSKKHYSVLRSDKQQDITLLLKTRIFSLRAKIIPTLCRVQYSTDRASMVRALPGTMPTL